MNWRSNASVRSIAGLGLAVVAGIGLGMLAGSPRFDDTGILVVGLGASAAVASLLLDRGLASALVVGLIPGLGVALIEVTRSDAAVALIPLAVAALGAVIGHAAARALRAGASGDEVATTR